jgi:hypothetical protein
MVERNNGCPSFTRPCLEWTRVDHGIVTAGTVVPLLTTALVFEFGIAHRNSDSKCALIDARHLVP